MAAADRLKEFAQSTGLPGPTGNTATMHSSAPEGGASTKKIDELEVTLSQVTTRLLEAIQVSATSLTGKIEEVKIDEGLLRHDLQTLRGRGREVEDRVSTLEDATTPILSKVEELEKARKFLGAKGG